MTALTVPTISPSRAHTTYYMSAKPPTTPAAPSPPAAPPAHHTCSTTCPPHLQHHVHVSDRSAAWLLRHDCALSLSLQVLHQRPVAKLPPYALPHLRSLHLSTPPPPQAALELLRLAQAQGPATAATARGQQGSLGTVPHLAVQFVGGVDLGGG